MRSQPFVSFSDSIFHLELEKMLTILGFELLENCEFMNSMDDPEKCTILIFREWLAGKGEEVTWEVLIRALWRCKLTRLSDEVKTALRDFRHSK